MKRESPDDIAALANLLQDENEEIAAEARNKLTSLSPEFIAYLKTTQTRNGSSPVCSQVEYILEELHFVQLRREIRSWLWSRESFHLEKGAILIASFAYPGLDRSAIQAQIEGFAQVVLEKTRSQDSVVIQDSERTFYLLNHYLFKELGFRGNAQNYYDPENSFINRVLERKIGIPITLSVLLLAVGRRLNLPLHGIGMPGHFLVKYDEGRSSFFADAFNGGRILSKEDCKKWLISSGYGFNEEFLSPVTDQEIIARMIRNLISIYQKSALRRHCRVLSDYLTLVD